ncbi:hypothetical protein ACVMIX_003845 [Rhizobium leguminosarum]
MTDTSYRNNRDLRSSTGQEYDEIVEQMLTAVRSFVDEKCDAPTKLHLEEPAVVAKLRTALFDCLAAYAETQFFDPQEDLYKTAADAEITAGILKQLHGLLSSVPTSSREWYSRHVAETKNPFNADLLSSIEEAHSFFDARSKPPQGRKMNLPIILAVEPAVKAAEIALGRKMRRVVEMAKDRHDGFVDLDAILVARILRTLDSNIKPEQVRTALQRYFRENKLK